MTGDLTRASQANAERAGSSATTPAATPVTVIGEALIDVIVLPDGSTTEHIGGSPANVAIGLARLGHPTRLETFFAPDPRGLRIADAMAAEGVTVQSSRRASRTSVATARLDASGAAAYEFDLAWELDAADISVPMGGHVHTGSIAATTPPGAEGIHEVILGARAEATVSYDPNVRPSLMGSPDRVRPTIERLVALADVVKASDEDVAWLYGPRPLPEVLTDWASVGPALTIVTCGGEGIVVRFAGEIRRLPAPASSVVDTVGAGDSFMAGLISGLLDAGLLGGPAARQRLRAATWDSLTSALHRALDCAAITVARAGANPPRRDELAGHLEESAHREPGDRPAMTPERDR